MSSPGEFAKCVADALHVPEPTVAVHDRNLRTAGLRSKSGRGRGAAKVTARDAASLLVAVLGSEQVKDSADAVRRYGTTGAQLRPADRKALNALGITELTALPRDHSFIDAVEALIESAATGSLATWTPSPTKGTRKADDVPLIEIAAHSPGTFADIRLADTKRGITVSIRYTARGISVSRADIGLQQYRFITTPTLLRVAQALVD